VRRFPKKFFHHRFGNASKQLLLFDIKIFLCYIFSLGNRGEKPAQRAGKINERGGILKTDKRQRILFCLVFLTSFKTKV